MARAFGRWCMEGRGTHRRVKSPRPVRTAVTFRGLDAALASDLLPMRDPMTDALGGTAVTSRPPSVGAIREPALIIAVDDDPSFLGSIVRLLRANRSYSVDRFMAMTYYRRESDKTALRQGLQRAGLS